DCMAEEFETIVTRCDEPIADPSAMAQLMLYKAARDHGLKVLLSGIGGDEVFFGYDTWNGIGESIQVQGFLQPDWPNRLPGYGRAAWLLRAIARPEFAICADEDARLVAEYVQGMSPGVDAVYSFLFGSYLVHNGLLLSDKLSMAASVELRVPLVDHVLIESVLALPLQARYSEGTTKPLLRQIAPENIPSNILTGPKRCFATPSSLLRTLVKTNSEAICEGRLASTWLDRDRLRSLTARLPLIDSYYGRVSNALAWRAWAQLSDHQRLALPFASSIAAEFLFRVLCVERWWSNISRPHWL
ncbi:MAG: asparagine synthase C-terminal domain-containing protein, partial [Candidatus Korobacteraceae bacterium]